MSLFTTASSANLLQTRGPTSRSDSVLAVFFASGLSIPVWVTDTIHEEAYSYIGLTKSAAYAIAEAMNGSVQVTGMPAPLRQTVTAPEVTVSDGTPSVTVTSRIIQTGVAVPTLTAGGMWSVDVSISYQTQTLELA